MPTPFSFLRISQFIAGFVIFLVLSSPSVAQTKAEPPAGESFDTFHLEHLKFLKMSAATEKTVLQQNVVAAMVSAIRSAPHEEDKEQTPEVQSLAAASKAMAFPVAIVSARKDQPVFQINKKESADFTIDRASLQEMLDQAKRPDLLLPASFEQARVQLKIPQSLVEMYGQCGVVDSHRPNADAANVDASNGEPADDAEEEVTAKKAPLDANDCLVFFQIPIPEARISSSMRFPLVMQILAQLVGDSDQLGADSASVDWTNTFPVPVPPSFAAMETVQVNGSEATLIRLKERGNSTVPFFLIWIRDGKIYALMGPGDPANAKQLADSVQ